MEALCARRPQQHAGALGALPPGAPPQRPLRLRQPDARPCQKLVQDSGRARHPGAVLPKPGEGGQRESLAPRLRHCASVPLDKPSPSFCTLQFEYGFDIREVNASLACDPMPPPGTGQHSASCEANAHFRAGMHRGVLRDAAGKMINATCCGIAWGMILIECVGPTRHEPAPSGVNSVRRAPRQHLTASAARSIFFSPPAQPH